jgi:hypothetical protein
MLMQFAQVKEPIDPAKQMAGWNVIFQVECVEQWRLANVLTSHHREEFHSIDGKSVNQSHAGSSREFFNGIGQEQTLVVDAPEMEIDRQRVFPG